MVKPNPEPTGWPTNKKTYANKTLRRFFIYKMVNLNPEQIDRYKNVKKI